MPRSASLLLRVAAIAVAAILGASGPATAGDAVPFKGLLEGTYTRTGAFPFFHLEPVVTGQATHLGRFVCSLPHDVNLLLIPAGGTGTFEFTSANGDTIFGTFDTEAEPTPVPGVLYALEEMTITGGTGRFAHASGGFQCVRFVDTVNLTTVGWFEGIVSTPGARKP